MVPQSKRRLLARTNGTDATNPAMSRWTTIRYEQDVPALGRRTVSQSGTNNTTIEPIPGSLPDCRKPCAGGRLFEEKEEDHAEDAGGPARGEDLGGGGVGGRNGAKGGGRRSGPAFGNFGNGIR